MSTTDDWYNLLAAIQQYVSSKYIGQTAVELSLRLSGGGRVKEPIPPTAVRIDVPPQQVWASGPAPKHTEGFRRVYWPGLGEFTFSWKQGAAVRELWAAWEEQSPGVSQEAVLQAAESDCARLYDLFRRHSAWGVLIIQGDKSGTYRLAEVEE